jgi:hypothetical protein
MLLCLGFLIFLTPANAVDFITNYHGFYQPQPRPYDRVLDFLPPSKLNNLDQAKKLLVQTAKILPEAKNRKPLSERVLRTRIRKTLKLDWLSEHLKEHPPRIELIDETLKQGYVEQKFKITDEIIGSFPVLLLLPINSKEKAPAILGLHGHGGSMEDFRDILMGAKLAREGYAVLIPRFRAMYNLYEHEISKTLMRRGYHLLGFRVFEVLLSLKILQNHPLINREKWGILAHSGGSAIAHLLVYLVDGVSACISDYDSSYHFPWEELCCEAVPELAIISQQLNQRSNFPCPALKAPYHFSPQQKEILKFFQAQLGRGVEKIAKRKFENSFMSLIQLKSSASLGQGSPDFKSRMQRQAQFLLSHLVKQIKSLPFDVQRDQKILSLLQILLLLDDTSLALKVARLLNLPKTRAKALSQVLSQGNPKKMTRKKTQEILTEIDQDLQPFESPLVSVETRLDISLDFARNRQSWEALSLLKHPSLTTPILLHSERLRSKLLKAYQRLIIHGDHRKESLSNLVSFPKKFRFQALIGSASKILNPALRKRLRLEIQKTLNSKTPTKPVDSILFTLSLARIFPEIPQPLDERFISTLAGVQNLSPQAAMELGSEFLHHNYWTAIKQTLQRLDTVQNRCELLLKLLSPSSEVSVPKELIAILKGHLKRVKEPATLVGFYEELLEILLENRHRKEFLLALSEATQAMRRIQAPFDRQDHIRNLGRLGALGGAWEQVLILLRSIPAGYSQAELKKELSDLYVKSNGNTPQQYQKQETGSIAIRSGFDLIANSPYDRLISLHQASRNSLNKAMLDVSQAKRTAYQVELAKGYSERGLIQEAEEILEVITNQINNQNVSLRFQSIREVSDIFSTLKNQAALENCLRSYLRFLAGMLPNATWVKPSLKLVGNESLSSKIPKVFFRAFFTWLIQHTHWRGDEFPAFCIQVYEEEKTSYFAGDLKGVCEDNSDY